MKCSSMCAGMLRHRVEIHSIKEVPDGGGGFIDEWQTDATVWAQIKPVSGVESLVGMQLQDSVTHDIIMRYRQLKAKQRIKFGDRLFNIQSVIDIEERGRWLQIRAEEGVAH
jgi:SPP1 family predicted phage head-tail adaptor